MFKELMRSPKYRRRLSWIIAGSLLLPLAFYFQGSSRNPARGPGGAAGMMFGKPVPWDVFQAERAQLRRVFEQQFGGVPDMLLPMLTQSTWDRLLLVEEAKRRRIPLADRELIDAIQQDPGFHKGGRFDLPTYRALLRAQGMAPQAYEERVRQFLLGQKLMQSITEAITVTDEEVEAAYRLQHEQRRALIVLVRPTAFLEEAAAALTDQDLRGAYDAHPDWVRVPEQLTLEYAGLSTDEAAAAVTPTDEQIASYYAERSEEFLREDGTPKPLEDVRGEIQQQLAADGARRRLNALLSDLEEDLEATRPFEEMLAARGLIARTAGPLAIDSAWAPTGPDPAFLDALRELPAGATSGVIELANGMYVARLITRIPSKIPPFEEVQQTVRQRLAAEHSRGMAQERAAALHARLSQRMTQGWRFEEAVVAEPWMPSVSATLSRGSAVDSAIGAVPEINQAVFATTVGQLSQLIETQAGFTFVRPEAVLPLDLAALTAQKETFQQDVLTRKRSEQFEAWMKDLRARAKLQSFVDLPSSS